MTRREARVLAFMLIYQAEIQNDSPENIMEVYYLEHDIEEKARDYVEDVFYGFCKNKESIDGIITKYLDGWKLERVAKISLSAIRLSVYEIFHRSDIPSGVSINEAVDIVKKYSGTEESSFVNGLLSSVLRSKEAGTEQCT